MMKSITKPISRPIFRSLFSEFSPLSLSPVLLYSNNPIPGADPAIPIARVREVPSGDEFDIHGLLPTDTRYIQKTQGGAFTLQSDDVYVITWYDRSGNGHHITNTTIVEQPQLVWSSPYTDYPVLDFDGVDDGLMASGPVSQITGDYTIFILSEQGTQSGWGCLFDFSSDGTDRGGIFINSGHVPTILYPDSEVGNSTTVAGSALTVGNYTNISIINGETLYYDMTQISLGTPDTVGTPVIDGIGMGQSIVGGSFPYSGKNSGMGLFPRRLSLSEITKLIDFFRRG